MGKITIRIAISKKNFKLGLIALGVLGAWLVVLSGLIMATAGTSTDKNHSDTRDTRGGTGLQIGSPNKHSSTGVEKWGNGRGVSRRVAGDHPCVQTSAACSSENRDMNFEVSSGHGIGIRSAGIVDSISRGSSSSYVGLYDGVFESRELSTFGKTLPFQNVFAGTSDEPVVNGSSSTGEGSQGDSSQTVQDVFGGTSDELVVNGNSSTGLDSQGDGSQTGVYVSTPSDPANPNPFFRRFAETEPLVGPDGYPPDDDSRLPQDTPALSATQPIPEPWTLAIFAFGVAAVAMTRRRAMKSALPRQRATSGKLADPAKPFTVTS
jgi:hypothetical protein